ncbi:MAG TPA: glycosyltransferase family 2 protein [Glaciibacter sp.]|nr:glycosyltransferase family 2 protein [Glaciibacter sp.]
MVRLSTSEFERCTVIVVNWNGGDDTAECLRSLAGQTAEGVTVDLLVVDNGSTDGSADMIERDFPDVSLLRTGRNLGFGGAVNRGIAASSGDYLILVNNDAVATPGFVDALLAPLRVDPHVAAVTARILLTGRFEPAAPGDAGAYRRSDNTYWRRTTGPGVELLNSTGNVVSRSGNGQDRSWLVPADTDDSPVGVFGFSGGGCALRRSALEDVGVFDESLFMYYEDTDLAWRLRRNGWDVVYAREATLRHRHAGSSGVTSRLFLVNNVRNRVIVSAKNGPPRMVLAALWRAVGSLVKSALHVVLRRDTAARRRLVASALGLLGVVGRLPAAVVARRRLDRHSREPRSMISDWVVDD